MNSSGFRRLVAGGIVLLLPIVALWVFLQTPAPPAAFIRVRDPLGTPVPGAAVRIEGLRTKPGPYQGNWYACPEPFAAVVTTDGAGVARMPYPRNVFEKIETGTLCLSVDHPNFVPDRPERVVASALPAGAPVRQRLGDLWDRIRRHSVIVRPDPVVLKVGANLFFNATSGPVADPARLFVMTSGLDARDSNSWIRPGPGVIGTRRLAPGKPMLQVVQLDSNGVPWFSETMRVDAVAGRTNEVSVGLYRGSTVRGNLDAGVPRPVRQGRVVAQVWPEGFRPEDSPPSWHAWTPVDADGSFQLVGLPAGKLEVVVLCDGFISTNGPGRFSMRYPQVHALGREDLSIVVGMEPTARVSVRVVDEGGSPIRGARVVAWPNVRYGEWSATVVGSDLHNTAEFLMDPSGGRGWRIVPVPDFEGVADEHGEAVIPNLPATTDRLGVEHPEFVLPASGTPAAGMQREARISLVAGSTNRIVLHMEPKGRSPVGHY
ncbi:MAG: hypothetical protein JNL10_09950 [Verrucomicrobiales bacterium]|nr:hypothetical protein [Verrucomicrobiales bacterium]